MILLSYDKSLDANAAIDRVAKLMPGAETMILTVWEPLLDTLTRTGALGMGMAVGTYADSEEVDAASREAALGTATEGAQRATAAGLVAHPRCERRHGDVANTILAVAADVDADLIVMGTRGRGGVQSFLLGSVSHAVVQHADRAVMVAPSPALAVRRRDRLDEQTPAPAYR